LYEQLNRLENIVSTALAHHLYDKIINNEFGK
jgi:hypothetical protein